MSKRLVYIFGSALVLIFAVVGVALAVNTSGAKYSASLTAYNSGDAVSVTSTAFTVSSGSLIDAAFMSSTALNMAVVRGGEAVPAMPASARLSMAACMASTTSFSIETTECNSSGVNDITLMRISPVAGDGYVFGFHTRARILNLNIGLAGSGTWAFTWEYTSDGSTWTALRNVVDDTQGFTKAGLHSITWDMPEDWQEASVNGVLAYYVRARLSSFTSATVQPLGTNATYETGQLWVYIDSLALNEQKLFTLYLGGGIQMRSAHSMFVGAEGITTTDAGDLELGSRPYVIKISGAIDTSATSGNSSSTARNLIFKNEAIRLYVSSTQQVGLELYGDSQTATTSVSGITPGPKYVRIIGNVSSTTAILEVGNGSATSTANISALSISDNSNSWAWGTNQSMPYIDRIEITFGLVLDYDDTAVQWSDGTFVNTSATSTPGSLALQLSTATSTGSIIDNIVGAYASPGRIQSGIRMGQSFTPANPTTLDSLDLLLRGSQHYGTSTFTGNVTVNIYEADGSGAPTGASLGSSSVAAATACPNSTTTESNFVFSPGISLTSGTEYVIEVQRDNVAGTCLWGATGTAYSGGQAVSSTDAGSTWSAVANSQYAIPNAVTFAPFNWTVTVGDAGPNSPNDCSNELDDGFGEFRGINTGPDDLTSYCSVNTTGSMMFLNTNGLVNPGVSTGHILRFRVTKSNNTITLRGYLFSNSTATLTTGINGTTTTVPVSDGSLFEIGDLISIDGNPGNPEIMTVSNVVSNDLTVTRGSLNTTQVTHAEGAKVYLMATNGLVSNVTTIDVWETVEYTLDSDEVAKINDYGDLRIYVYYTNTGSTPNGRISAIEFEVPNIARDFQFEINGDTSNQYLPSGIRTSDNISLGIIKSYETSTISWVVTTNASTTAAVKISLDGGTSWLDATNGGEVPGLTVGADLTSTNLIHRAFLTSTDELFSPLFDSLSLRVEGASTDGLLYSLTSTPSVVLVDQRAGHTGVFNFPNHGKGSLTSTASAFKALSTSPDLAAQGDVPAIIPKLGELPNLFATTTTTGLPFDDFLRTAATNGGLPATLFWRLIAIGTSIIFGVIVMMVFRGNFFVGMVAVTIGFVAWSQIGTGGIIPLWIAIVFAVIAAGAIVIKEKVLA